MSAAADPAPASPARRLAPVTAAVLLASVLGWWAAVPSPAAVPARLTWALPCLVLLVVLAESAQLRVEIRRQTV